MTCDILPVAMFEFDGEETPDVDDKTVGQLDGQITMRALEEITLETFQLIQPSPSNQGSHLRPKFLGRIWRSHWARWGQWRCRGRMNAKRWDTCWGDWNNYQVNIQLIHLFSWQADNPYINPAWLFKEINRVMKNRLDLKSAWKRSTTLLMSSYLLLRTTN